MNKYIIAYTDRDGVFDYYIIEAKNEEEVILEHFHRCNIKCGFTQDELKIVAQTFGYKKLITICHNCGYDILLFAKIDTAYVEFKEVNNDTE